MLAVLISAFLLNPSLQQGSSGSSIPIGNYGFDIKVHNFTENVVLLGDKFEAQLFKENREAFSYGWESLTPEVCQLVEPSRGIFKPLRAGVAVLRATALYRVDHPSTGPKDIPIFVPVISVVTVKPLKAFIVDPQPDSLYVGADHAMSVLAFRDTSIDLPGQPFLPSAQARVDANKKRGELAVFSNAFDGSYRGRMAWRLSHDPGFNSTDFDETIRTKMRSLLEQAPTPNRPSGQETLEQDNEYRGFRSTLTFSQQKSIDELISRVFSSPLPSAKAALNSTNDKEIQGLLADLPVKVESLTPDIVQIGLDKKEPRASVTIDNAEDFTLHPISGGTGIVTISCGGIVKELKFQVVDAELSLTPKSKVVRQDKTIEANAQVKDRKTGKTVPVGSIVVSDSANGTIATTSTPTGKTVSISNLSPGAHTLQASLVVEGTSILTAKAEVTVRTISSSVRVKPLIKLVAGDTSTVHIVAVDKDGKTPEGLTADDVSFEITNKSIVSATKGLDKDGPFVRFQSIGDGVATVNVRIDDKSSPVAIKVDPQLELTSAVTSESWVRRFFGDEIAKNFIIRKLTFINRLNDIGESEELKGKDIVCYASTIFSRVIVARRHMPYSDQDLENAIKVAHDYDTFSVPSRNADETDDSYAQRIANSYENSQLDYEKDIRAFMLSQKNVTVMPYNPVLFNELSLVKDSIYADRSEDVITRIFDRINLVTTFFGGINNLRNIGIPLSLVGVHHDRNPFAGTVAASNRDAIRTLFQSLLAIDVKVRDARGGAFSSDYVLDGTLSVSAGSPAIRYLFIPKDSIASYSKKGGKVVIIDLLDSDLKIGYRVVQDAKGTATAKPTIQSPPPGGKSSNGGNGTASGPGSNGGGGGNDGTANSEGNSNSA